MKIDELGTDKNKFYFAILILSIMFQEFSRNLGFGIYCNVGAMKLDRRRFFFERMFSAIQTNIQRILPVLGDWHPNVAPDNIRPYIQQHAIPNVISFIHLISQAICDEHV